MRSFVIACIIVWSASAVAAPLRTVPKVDLDRYMGTWHVISSYPEDDQEGCVGMKAVYTRTEDGFDLLNVCHKDGERDTLSGSVSVVDTATNAKLKARFYLVFTGAYWIIDLDPEYRWVVVGEPEREHVWIMARGRSLDAKTLAGITTRLKAQGYNPGKLVKMPHR
jgi:apolipoprotein D and lipocalin family protein